MLGTELFAFSRASLTFDLFVCAMVLMLPALSWSIFLVKAKQHYQTHAKLQLALSAVLGVLIVLFEIDVRFGNWHEHAELSPYFETILYPFLGVHLTIAVGTALLWIITTWQAVGRFGWPARPGSYSPIHRRLAWTAVIGMYLTIFTGIIFYFLAFVA